MHLIYLRSGGGILVSKKHYASWRDIQDEYENYMTSLGPWTTEKIIDFFRVDWGEDETQWPFSPMQIHQFAQSNEQILLSKPSV